MALVRVTVHADRARAATRDVRRHLGRDTKDVIARSVDRRTVPIARRRAPSIVAHSIVARATTTRAYLTTTLRGKRRRMFGLMEWGGTLRKPITPRRAGGVLHFRVNGRDVFVRRVSAPRTYPAKAFVRQAIEESRTKVLRDIERDLPDALQRRLHGIAKVTG